MNKILITILFLISLACTSAQVHDAVNGKPLVDFPPISSIENTDVVGIWDVSKGDLYKGDILSIINFGFNYDRVINGTFSFNNAPQLPIVPSSSLERGVKFVMTANGLRFGYSTLGHNYIMPNMDDLVAVGLGDTNDFARKSATNNYYGINLFNAGLGIGDLTLFTLGRVPSSYEFAGYGIVLGPGGELINKWKDWNNDKGQDTLATKKDLRNIELSSGGGNAIIAVGIQDGITSDITRTAGGVIYTGTSDASIHMYGLFDSPFEHVPGKLYGKFTTGFSVLRLQSTDENNDDITHAYPETPFVQYMIDAALSSNAPQFHSDQIDTVDFTYRNYINGIYTSQGEQTIIVKNYEPGWVSFIIHSQSEVTITIPGVNIDWVGDPNDNNPNFSNGEYIEVNLKYITSTLAKGAYSW